MARTFTRWHREEDTPLGPWHMVIDVAEGVPAQTIATTLLERLLAEAGYTATAVGMSEEDADADPCV